MAPPVFFDISYKTLEMEKNGEERELLLVYLSEILLPLFSKW